ncbi:MAG: methyltransferase domain-containing protein [Candidatus Nanoarchaeia archaeon]|nr:methyltransferase domain-containing protein [Candidatus Nanoarchaeia archaeon]
MLEFLLIPAIILLLIFAVWVSSCFFGAPFQPSSNRAMKIIMQLANPNKKQKMADLGSGNAKILIEFARRGIEAHGFEINPFLVWLSRRRIKSLGLQKKAFIHWKNFMKADLSKFDIITSFQISYIMPGLEKKLKKELRKGAKIISNTWKFPNWKPKKIIGHVYLYER